MQYKPKQFQTLLLRWFDQKGRKDLPWQQDKTPYRVWVSEIMLQQTQVSTVVSYYKRFISQFPDVRSLAMAKEDDVLHVWTGLGYYHRARNLQEAAKKIVADYNGQFPDTLEKLHALPGIGRSTAGAILSIAFQKAHPILDGNVKRVLTRLHGITEWSGERLVNERLWALAERYTPIQRVADFTQAIMDLGATVCRRGKPHCDSCPFVKSCVAHALSLTKTIPCAKPKKILPAKQVAFLILQQAGQVLLQKRTARGVWSGLWSFPEARDSLSATQIKALCRAQFQLTAKKIVLGAPFRHTFSHYHLDITPVYINVAAVNKKPLADQQQIWYNLNQQEAVGIPAPVKLLLSRLS